MVAALPIDRSDSRRRLRTVVAVVGSLAVHGVLAGAIALLPREERVPDPIVELTVLDLGDSDQEAPGPVAPPGGAPPAAAPTDAPKVAKAAERPARTRPAAAAQPAAVAAVAEDGIPVAEAEVEPSEVTTPSGPTTSFRDWDAARRPSFTGLVAGNGGSGGGTGAANGNGWGGGRKGVDRCRPPAGRRPEVVFLLFDSSGSMSQTSGPNAMTCAHDYAKGALESGATVVVGNFARGVSFFPPTTQMLDVELALRTVSDPTATNLPTRELQPIFDGAAASVADLVIVSDGIFQNTAELKLWYGYFMELNPDNRGRMFTVNGFGARDAVATLRGLGFDVYMYDPLAKPPVSP